MNHTIRFSRLTRLPESVSGNGAIHRPAAQDNRFFSMAADADEAPYKWRFRQRRRAFDGTALREELS